jgi:hypothetical protein
MLGRVFRAAALPLMISALATGCVLNPDDEALPDASRRSPRADASPMRSPDAGGAETDASSQEARDAGGGETDAWGQEARDAGGGETDASGQEGRDAESAGADASGDVRPDAGSADGSFVDGRDGGDAAIAEVCDGIDNDGNGVIDDLDVDHDGICDCMRIATLGYAGSWGEEDVFKSWLEGKSNKGAAALGARTLTQEALAPFQVILVQDVRESPPGSVGRGAGIGRAYSNAEVEALRGWVDQGGGLMTLSGYADVSELSNANRLLAPFGLRYVSTSVLVKSWGSIAIPIVHWAAHPIAEGVQKVGFDFGYPVSGGTLIAWEPTPGSWDVGRVAEYGAGRVFAWGDEWITYDSLWQNRSDYQMERFWLNSIQWLASAGSRGVQASSH